MQHGDKKRTLREVLLSPVTEYLMEAHNAISAKIVEETGFAGIWASGLTISSSLGVRDRNEITWTQVLDTVEYMTDAVSCPILLDVDTGYGDYNSFRRVVKKLCQRKVSGCCIEDKLFPKRNSFLGGRQELASIAEFTGKLKAGIDSKENDDFVIIARIEALIAGQGIDEALRRAEAYHEAGADAILIHSKESEADEILEFCRLFNGACPVAIVPTKYYRTPTKKFEDAGISTIIWANHSLRASVRAIRNAAETVFNEKSLISIEKEIAPLSEIFRLNGEHEMEMIEKRYLQAEKLDTNIIFLAASRGEYLRSRTEDRPKCLIEISGKPLLRHTINRARSVGIQDITVVSGYLGHLIDQYGVNNIQNKKHETTGECYSLHCALDSVKDSTAIAYGDLIIDDYILERLLKDDTDADVTVFIDRDNQKIPNHQGCFVRCSKAWSQNPLENEDVELLSIIDENDRSNAHGQWIGVLKIGGEGVAVAKEILRSFAESELQRSHNMDALLRELLVRGIRTKCVYVNGGWIDINTAIDIDLAEKAYA
jgi:phosphoenolpyruvate phosphomutase